jgi:predicted Ser/Thr protein kinase
LGAQPAKKPEAQAGGPPGDIGSRTQTMKVPALGAAGLRLNGRYAIERELGWGGFGVVYLARDETLASRLVVVKVLRDPPQGDDWYVRKFHQEIEALARIEHPGVVGALDAGRTPDGQPFLVMQYIEGTTLREALRDGGMDLARTAGIVREIGQALTAAHSKGVLHRDLKPENVMLQAPDGRVKLIDFGIASIMQSPGANLALTRAAGTSDYMAPEQFEGKVSPACDIFAFGVIAYEMLTGKNPFGECSSYFESLQRRKAGVQAPRELRPELPEAAGRALGAAMAVDPAARPRTAREFGDALADALTAPAELEAAYVLAVELRAGSREQMAELLQGSPRLRQAEAAGEVVRMPLPDGVALLFFRDAAAPVQCAMEVAAAAKGLQGIALRMGAHTSPAYRTADPEGNRVACEAAQRVLDHGDAGHILLSGELAGLLTRNAAWLPLLHDLGEPARLYSLWTGDLGNPACPRSCRPKRWRWLRS